MLQIRIGCHEHGKAFLLRRVKQLPVFQLRPTPFEGGGNFVLRQRVTQRFRSALIEQYAHLCRGKRTACGVIEYGTNLLQSDTRKPFHELRHQRAVFKIFKQGRHRHARTPEYPRSADAFWVPFNGWARRPIDHDENGTTTTPRPLSLSAVAALSRARISSSRSPCCAWVPALDPVSKNLPRPLCLKVRITHYCNPYGYGLRDVQRLDSAATHQPRQPACASLTSSQESVMPRYETASAMENRARDLPEKSSLPPLNTGLRHLTGKDDSPFTVSSLA